MTGMCQPSTLPHVPMFPKSFVSYPNPIPNTTLSPSMEFWGIQQL